MNGPVRPEEAARTGASLALSAVIILVAAGAFLALRTKTAVVSVAEARPAGDPATTALLNASGYVTPRRRATIAAKITARVVDVYVDEGMTVTEGQLLARLDDSDAAAAPASGQCPARRDGRPDPGPQGQPGQRGTRVPPPGGAREGRLHERPRPSIWPARRPKA